MPRWYSEGAAEFFASAAFRADGGVELGLPARHRGPELFYAADVTATDLLDPAAYAARKRKGFDAFYGKSWLLFHYLTFSKERRGQLTRYTTRLGQGATSREAAVEVFGDLGVLEKELDDYVRSRSLPFLPLQASMLEPGPIRVRKLRPGEAEMMPVRIRSQAGVSREQALELLPEARKVAARFPDDPMVLAALAEAEHDAGNNAEAIAAADAALARDPAEVEAWITKGFALFSLARQDADPVAAYGRARAPFLALNKLENDHPVPLLYYYYSFVRAGQPATANAFAGLERAVDFAPFAPSLRMTLATEQIQRGDLVGARRNLEPVAYNPHAGKLGEAAQRVLDRMAGPEPWDGSDLASVLAEPAPAE
jgi:Flp pilus assembly protein TadD